MGVYILDASIPGFSATIKIKRKAENSVVLSKGQIRENEQFFRSLITFTAQLEDVCTRPMTKKKGGKVILIVHLHLRLKGSVSWICLFLG